MALTRDYPRNIDEYPEIMSKLDPLIIRVSPTVLLVGSTSYTAKVKMGSMFNGYYIHVSGVGLPILKQDVDISGQSSTNGKGNKGENSDAWNYITDMARDWLDILEQSMLSNNSGKNIVDLLREIKFQNHFDLSGHTDMIEPYKDSVEVCTEGHTYPQDMLEQLTLLNSNLKVLNEAINGTNGLNKRVSDIEDKVNKNAEAIAALTEKLNTSLSNMSTTMSNMSNSVSDSITKTGTQISTAVENGLDSLVGQMGTMNTNIESVDSYIHYIYNEWDSNVKTIPNIKDIVDTISGRVLAIRDEDVPSIKATIASNNSSGAVGQVGSAVAEVMSKLNSWNTTIWDLDGALWWNGVDMCIRTELSGDNLMVDMDDGKRVKAVVD